MNYLQLGLYRIETYLSMSIYIISYCEKHDQGYIIPETIKERKEDIEKKVCKVDTCKGYHETKGRFIINNINELIVEYMMGQNYYDRCAGGWNIKYFADEIYDVRDENHKKIIKEYFKKVD